MFPVWKGFPQSPTPLLGPRSPAFRGGWPPSTPGAQVFRGVGLGGEGGNVSECRSRSWCCGRAEGRVPCPEPREGCSGAGVPAVTSLCPSIRLAGGGGRCHSSLLFPVDGEVLLRSHILEPSPDSLVGVPVAPQWPLGWPDRPVPESAWRGWPGRGRPWAATAGRGLGVPLSVIGSWVRSSAGRPSCGQRPALPCLLSRSLCRSRSSPARGGGWASSLLPDRPAPGHPPGGSLSWQDGAFRRPRSAGPPRRVASETVGRASHAGPRT